MFKPAEADPTSVKKSVSVDENEADEGKEEEEEEDRKPRRRRPLKRSDSSEANV
jgi:hypothetical protein